jgi:hypothetical protein
MSMNPRPKTMLISDLIPNAQKGVHLTEDDYHPKANIFCLRDSTGLELQNLYVKLSSTSAGWWGLDDGLISYLSNNNHLDYTVLLIKPTTDCVYSLSSFDINLLIKSGLKASVGNQYEINEDQLTKLGCRVYV